MAKVADPTSSRQLVLDVFRDSPVSLSAGEVRARLKAAGQRGEISEDKLKKTLQYLNATIASFKRDEKLESTGEGKYAATAKGRQKTIVVTVEPTEPAVEETELVEA